MNKLNRDIIRSNTAHLVPISKALLDAKTNRPSGNPVSYDVYLKQLNNASSFKARAEEARKNRNTKSLR